MDRKDNRLKAKRTLPPKSQRKEKSDFSFLPRDSAQTVGQRHRRQSLKTFSNVEHSEKDFCLYGYTNANLNMSFSPIMSTVNDSPV